METQNTSQFVDKPLFIVSATAKSSKEETLIYKSINQMFQLGIIKAGNYKIITNNTESLSKVYNQFLTKTYKDKTLVFVHDDVMIEDMFFKQKVTDSLRMYDIVGVAGTAPDIEIRKPALWHIMGDKGGHRGVVNHFVNGRFSATNFGETPARVILLDGVMMIVNTEKVLEKELKFDEECPSKFHFYDMNFSMEANQKQLKLGVYPICLTHLSPGLTHASEEFHKGQDYFIEKWASKEVKESETQSKQG